MLWYENGIWVGEPGEPGCPETVAECAKCEAVNMLMRKHSDRIVSCWLALEGEPEHTIEGYRCSVAEEYERLSLLVSNAPLHLSGLDAVDWAWRQ